MKSNLLLGPLLSIMGDLQRQLDPVDGVDDVYVRTAAERMLEKAYVALHREIVMRSDHGDDVWMTAVRHYDANGAVPYAMDQYGLTQPEAKVLINWYVDHCNANSVLPGGRRISVAL